jgi:hypothetical protein
LTDLSNTDQSASNDAALDPLALAVAGAGQDAGVGFANGVITTAKTELAPALPYVIGFVLFYFLFEEL